MEKEKKVLFCRDVKRLAEYERMMQQPPGYHPRRCGYQIFTAENTEISSIGKINRVVRRISKYPELLTKKSRPIRCNLFQFRNEQHRKLFQQIVGKYCLKCDQNRVIAILFLLSADSDLWKKVSGQLVSNEICFENIKIGSVNLEQYVLFHMAKDICTHKRLVSDEDLADKQLVPDEIFDRILCAQFILVYGEEILD